MFVALTDYVFVIFGFSFSYIVYLLRKISCFNFHLKIILYISFWSTCRMQKKINVAKRLTHLLYKTINRRLL